MPNRPGETDFVQSLVLKALRAASPFGLESEVLATALLLAVKPPSGDYKNPVDRIEEILDEAINKWI